jgi:hypothetical protein
LFHAAVPQTRGMCSATPQESEFGTSVVVNPRDPVSVKYWAGRFALSELALRFFMSIHGYRVDDLRKAVSVAHRGESEDRLFLQ